MIEHVVVWRCARCGEPYYDRADCTHVGTARNDIWPDHAERIKAAYAFGKRFNPDHDNTSYFEQTLLTPAREKDKGSPAPSSSQDDTVGGAASAGHQSRDLKKS